MELPPQSEVASIIGVEYVRLKMDDGGDMYLSRFGLPFWKQLAPENWYAADWFVERRIRLVGTSTIYRVPTKPVEGISLDLVVRFSRVGQELPLDPRILSEHPQAEFNSPFEELALVMQLRATHIGGSCPRLFTKKPLAIYVPSERLQEWQTGRLESKMANKKARHPEVRLDTLRLYILLYGWIEGVNAVEAAHRLGMTADSARVFLAETTRHVICDLEKHGFRMVDMKPEHIIVRTRKDGSLLRYHGGNLAYALVDYELLERIPNGNLPGNRSNRCAS